MPAPTINPNQLTFTRVSGPTRAVNQFDDRFLIRATDTFAADTSGNYTLVVMSGTTTAAFGSNQAAFSGAGAGENAYLAPEIPLAPYCWAELTVASGTGTPFVGFANSPTTNYVWTYYAGTQIGTDSKVGGTSTGGGSATVTLVAPYKLRMVMCYPEIWAWASDTNGDRPLCHGVITAGSDLRLLTQFPGGWHPLFGINRTAGQTGTFTQFRAGYTGGIGLRDFKPITHLDGRPYQQGTKRYFMATCATGAGFKTNHASVLSVDTANNFSPQIESLLFFNVAGTDRTNPVAAKDTRTSLYGGQILRDDANSKWLVLPNGWGYGDVTTGVQLWYAETTTDLTAGNRVLALDAYQRVFKDGGGVTITNGLYDNSQYFDSGTGKWRTVCAEANAVTNWTTYHATLFEGTTLFNQQQVAQDATDQAEGLNWCRIGGAWYATAGGTGGPWTWDSTLATVSTVTLDHTGVSFSFGGFGTHVPILPIQTGANTQYLLVGFDDSTVGGGNATKGAMFGETSQSLSGTEFVQPTYSLSGPASGTVSTPSSAFTVGAPQGSFVGSETVTITVPDGTVNATAAGGTITGNGTSAVTVTPAQGQTNFTFTYTPATSGVKTITPTNGQGWTDSAAAAYTSNSTASGSSRRGFFMGSSQGNVGLLKFHR